MSAVITEDQVALEFMKLKEIRLKVIEDERRIIEGRPSNSEPFPDGTFEKLSRNNIWKTVLQHLDPASLASAFSTCASFKSFSDESVIAHVLSLLKNNHFLHLGFWNKKNHDIWNLRLLSKSWKRAVEKIYLSEFSDPSWYVNYPHIFPLMHPSAALINQGPSLTRASNALQQSECGAQFCQVVQLSTLWYPETLDFLDKFGAIIQGVTFRIITGKFRAPLYTYLFLVKYLTRLPNIKWLEVDNTNFSPEDSTTVANDVLRDEIQKSPIPTIPSLDLIRIDNRLENELIVKEILRANPHVKSLELPNELAVTELVALQMEKLTSLEAYRVRFAARQALTQVTRVLSQVNWPLKHLNILQVFEVPTDILFSLINRFASTLEALGLHMDERRLPDLQQCRLELPKLKKMSFNEEPWNPNMGLDFLLPCRSLEQLQFAGFNCGANGGNSGGTVLVDWMKIKETNVWRWFPRLVCMRIERYRTDLVFFKPIHFVRKGLSRVVRVSSTLDCDIKCRDKFIPDH